MKKSIKNIKKYCLTCGGEIKEQCEFCRKDRIIKPRDTHPYQAMKEWPYT